MRFFFFDRFLELEPGERALAIKTLGIEAEHLGAHYPRAPVVAASLVLESMAQVAGWLNLASHDFRINMVLALVEGHRTFRPPRLGETLTLEAWRLFPHPNGSTSRTEARVGDEVVASVERMLFAYEATDDPGHIARARAQFEYVGGDAALAAGSSRPVSPEEP